MFNKQKFLAAVAKNRSTIDELANRLSVDSTTVYRKMNGVSDFTRAEIQELRLFLSLSAREADAIFFAKASAETQEPA